METQILLLASGHFSLRGEEDKKENIPPFSSNSSASVLPFPQPRKPFQDITGLIAHNGRPQSSVAEATSHVALGVHTSSKKCRKKKNVAISSRMSRQIHEMLLPRKGFRIFYQGSPE